MGRRALVVAGLLMLGAGAARAQSATQVVRFSVLPQSRAEVSPVREPVSLHSDSAGVSTSVLTLSTNDSSLKVTASLDRPLPPGASLSLVVGDRIAGADAGGRQLGTAATDVLTGLTPTSGARVPIAYRVSASRAEAARAGAQRVVTYTILAAP